MGLIPRSGRSPGGGHGNPLQSSCLENPVDRGAWRAMVPGVAESDTTEVTWHGRIPPALAGSCPETPVFLHEVSPIPRPHADWFGQTAFWLPEVWDEAPTRWGGSGLPSEHLMGMKPNLCRPRWSGCAGLATAVDGSGQGPAGRQRLCRRRLLLHRVPPPVRSLLPTKQDRLSADQPLSRAPPHDGGTGRDSEQLCPPRWASSGAPLPLWASSPPASLRQLSPVTERDAPTGGESVPSRLGDLRTGWGT